MDETGPVPEIPGKPAWWVTMSMVSLWGLTSLRMTSGTWPITSGSSADVTSANDKEAQVLWLERTANGPPERLNRCPVPNCA